VSRLELIALVKEAFLLMVTRRMPRHNARSPQDAPTLFRLGKDSPK